MTLSIAKPVSRRPRPRGAGLVTGDRLGQREFHRRYEQTPHGFKAELIGGVVHVASPARLPHGRFTQILSTLLGAYEAATPGVQSAGNVTTILGDDSEPQPDLLLRIRREFGGQSGENAQRYLVGPPELIIEVSHSTEALDLHAKRDDYRKAGVLEYLVYRVAAASLRAFDLGAGEESDVDDAVFRSRYFPGLWIDVTALNADDMRGVLATGGDGLASAEHGKFVERLGKRAKAARSARPGRKRK